MRFRSGFFEVSLLLMPDWGSAGRADEIHSLDNWDQSFLPGSAHLEDNGEGLNHS